MNIEQNKRRTPPAPPWPKGVSGNPRGRPRKAVVHDVRALARQHAPEALQILVTLMHHEDPRVAVRAAEAVLDRAYGSPRPELVDGAEPGGFTIVLRQYVLGPNGSAPGAPPPVVLSVENEAPAALALDAPEPLAAAVQVRLKHFTDGPPA